jgi:hypothetical protein
MTKKELNLLHKIKKQLITDGNLQAGILQYTLQITPAKWHEIFKTKEYNQQVAKAQ